MSEGKQVSEHKHLGLILDSLLNFAALFKEKLTKARTGIGLIKHLREYLPTDVLDQIYKMHVRPHFDYCDFIDHILDLIKYKDNENGYENDHENDLNETLKANLNFRMKSLESIQYQAVLAVTGAWKGTNTEKVYCELGWEGLIRAKNWRFSSRI